ncbi:MAG: DNA replication and repair protein RecF [Chloroflexota bacterium]
MRLSSLSLTAVRSYPALALELGPGLTVVCGENGQGKSNLLEACYLLALGRSYRAATDRDLIAWDAVSAGTAALIAARIERAAGPLEARVGLEASGEANVLKRVRLNGVAKRAADLVGALAAVLFSADDLALISGPPAGRRRYLDVLLSQASHPYLRSLQHYQRVLTQRNALLKGLKEGRAREDELAYWDDALAAGAASLLAARYGAVSRLAPLAAEAYARLAGDGRAFSVGYAGTVPFAGEAPSPADAAAALAASRGQERARGMTVVGPHRDDLRLTLDGVEMARHASRGQQRLAALALRLAEGRWLAARRGEQPVVLLDDVLSELDAQRRAQVLEEVAGADQVIVTTADLGLLPWAALAGARVLRVAGGMLEAQEAAR